MTREDLIATLRRLHRLGDPERAHALADDALLAYINDEEIIAAYEALLRWYA